MESGGYSFPMAPKGKAPAKAKESAASLWQRAGQHALETAGAAREAFGEAFDAAYASARNSELDAKRVPCQVERIMSELSTLVDYYFVSADAGIRGPDTMPPDPDDSSTPVVANWDAEPTPPPSLTDTWSRGQLQPVHVEDRRKVMRFRKPGAKPPPMPADATCRAHGSAHKGLDRPGTGTLSAPGLTRPSSAATATPGRATAPCRPSSAAVARSASGPGGLTTSASQPAVRIRPIEAAPRRLDGAGKHAGGATNEPQGSEMTSNGYLICRGPAHLQPAAHRARLTLGVDPDPEAAKIAVLQARLAAEREAAKASIAAIEKSLKKGTDFTYHLHGEPLLITRPNLTRVPLIPNAFRGPDALGRCRVVRDGTTPGVETVEAAPAAAVPAAAGGRRRAAASASKPASKPAPSRSASSAGMLGGRGRGRGGGRGGRVTSHVWQQEMRAIRSHASFTELKTIQPPLSQTLRLSSGVRLANGIDDLAVG